MKKYAVLLIFTLMVLLSLTSCSSVSALLTSITGGNAQNPQLSDETRLIIGTFKLEGSDQAVTPQQAAQLLPLWKAVRSLSASDTASQLEIQALYEQIRETMTSEQLQVIDSVNLNNTNMRELMQELNIQMPAGMQMPVQRDSTNGQTQGSSTRQGIPGGDMMMIPMEGGGPPPGFGGGSQQTGSSTTGTAARTGVWNSPLLTALIEMLKTRAAQSAAQ